jgi:hypothetical protein
MAGATHRQHKPPHLAIYALSAITFIIIAVMALAGITVINIYSEAATLGTYGYLLCYFLVALACPVMLWYEGRNLVLAVIVGGLAAAGIAYVVYSSVYPVPAGAYKWMPYEFLGILLRSPHHPGPGPRHHGIPGGSVSSSPPASGTPAGGGWERPGAPGPLPAVPSFHYIWPCFRAGLDLTADGRRHWCSRRVNRRPS